jgi:CarD family transcriptional regulator
MHPKTAKTAAKATGSKNSASKVAAKAPMNKTAPKAPAAKTVAKPVSAPAKPAAAAPRVEEKKVVTQRQGFKANEFVVYPAHGVGQILAIEEQEIAGAKLELFVINFMKDKMTLRVPTAKVANVGMRKLSEPALVKKALETLKGRARVKRTMWSRRAQEYEAKINSGDIVAIAEVVRDLYRSESQPEQSYSERQLYEAALDRPRPRRSRKSRASSPKARVAASRPKAAPRVKARPRVMPTRRMMRTATIPPSPMKPPESVIRNSTRIWFERSKARSKDRAFSSGHVDLLIPRRRSDERLSAGGATHRSAATGSMHADGGPGGRGGYPATAFPLHHRH